MVNRALSYLQFYARKLAHFRFEEPILVFESDDWGKVAGREDGNYPTEGGKRTDWSHDRLETDNELEALYSLLESFADDFERKPVFTANFIVSNPDFEKTVAGGFKQLYLKPIDQAFPELQSKWREGIDREVFYPQYHGRLHHNFAKYAKAIKEDAITQKLFQQEINGGRENFEPTQYALYSEYFDTSSSSSASSLTEWLKHGRAEFKRIFDYDSTTTVAPNYVLNPADINSLKSSGFAYLQAANKILYTQKGQEQHLNYAQGREHQSGLVFLARNHKFEPNRGRKEWQAGFSIEAVKYWLKRGVPAVLDTHRFNYVSNFADNSLQDLKTLLSAMRKVKNLRILTSCELGQAIAQGGIYTDVFSGEEKKLTPIDSSWRKLLRQHLQ